MSKNSNKDLKDILITSSLGENISFIPINDSEAEQVAEAELPDTLPILALRNAVLFPSVVIPITVGRDKSIRLIKDAYAGTRLIGAVSQLDPAVEDPTVDDLNKIGTLARIIKIFEMPDGAITVLLQGVQRLLVKSFTSENPYFMAQVEMLADHKPELPDADYEGIISSIRDLTMRVIRQSPNLPQEAAFAIKNIESDVFLINFVASSTEFSEAGDKQLLLEIDGLKERGLKLIELLNHEIQLLEIKDDIQRKVRSEIDQQQREYFLHQQMKTIQDELGGNPAQQEVDELREKAEDKKWTDEIADAFEKEIAKLEKMNPMAGEFSVQLNYLQLMVDLPWNEYTTDNLNLKHAQEVLDEDHFGLDQVKERIIEYLAVLKLKGDLKSPVICLYGPPGVGKTSLGKSVARALGREFGRISLGGLHDEAEIRGHRRTYIGAMPGRIIQTINRAKSANPVIILDEIDKVGADFRGDPSSALLEVLDPEQNSTFHDNYLDLDFDLSKVLFITTANNIATIHPALRDRMEMINISGYLTEEKVEIAKQHLIPKQLELHGLKPKKLLFDDDAVEVIIDEYTRESGVRSLDRQIAKVVRNKAKDIAFGKKVKKEVTAKNVRDILGVQRIQRDVYQGNDFAGVVTGLAWTEMGGDILFIEASLSRGKGTLTLTGNLGDVMKESAVIALEYIKAHADHLNIPADVFDKWNVHIHVPEGAIPKDGPSAGITMATALASAFTQRKVRKNIAMTGEITLRGKVLPVGGIKEKILAAKRAGIKEIVLSKDNEKDILDIKEVYIKGLKFHYVETITDVLNFALLKEKVKDALTIK